MASFPEPFDWRQLKVYPLASRRSLSAIEEILVDPKAAPPSATDFNLGVIRAACAAIRKARSRKASVMLLYGAHLVKNGAASLVRELMEGGWITHLATNGAGSIHDWEFAFQNWSTESVEQNVATGTFGAWDETGRFIHLALMAGALRGEGYGVSVGRFIAEDGVDLPTAESLETALRATPGHPLSPARADLLVSMRTNGFPSGRVKVAHPWKHTSIFGNAFRLGLPLTVHPGIGYDIITNHPLFNGGVLGRAGGIDFQLFTRAVDSLDDGVVLSVGSAIMAPQVFEKSLSCVNNLRLQAGRPVVKDHQIVVVDLQDGGNWDWTRGEPPRDNPAYYLRFCKSFSRIGGAMSYAQCDNVVFLHQLLHHLRTP
ncbi:MAG: hypothetical protein HY299_17785 [Verrucomicrobia bacterium]|nr:hypothetical protein [Verrucomicrobiota bacterium]